MAQGWAVQTPRPPIMQQLGATELHSLFDLQRMRPGWTRHTAGASQLVWRVERARQQACPRRQDPLSRHPMTTPPGHMVPAGMQLLLPVLSWTQQLCIPGTQLVAPHGMGALPPKPPAPPPRPPTAPPVPPPIPPKAPNPPMA